MLEVASWSLWHPPSFLFNQKYYLPSVFCLLFDEGQFMNNAFPLGIIPLIIKILRQQSTHKKDHIYNEFVCLKDSPRRDGQILFLAEQHIEGRTREWFISDIRQHLYIDVRKESLNLLKKSLLIKKKTIIQLTRSRPLSTSHFCLFWDIEINISNTLYINDDLAKYTLHLSSSYIWPVWQILSETNCQGGLCF